jgi:light-regulated signal transduction histidine kinase (bacteriophytochrome)
MGELIDDLLDLSRVSRLDLKRNRVNLSELVRRVAEELAKKEPDRNVDWQIEDGLVAHADRRLIQIALENLLGNAWKFTAKGASATIEVRAERHAGDLVFVVRDNGAGFDMTYADKLFLPFQRLHDMADFPGTGIGLAIVRRIVDRHGGRVWAEGAIGRGATMFFTIPPARVGYRLDLESNHFLRAS